MTSPLTKHEEAILVSRLAGAVEQRVSRPRGERYGVPGTENHSYHNDRYSREVYGLFWNNRLLGLDRTVWKSRTAPIAAFNEYVRRVLCMLDEEHSPSLPEDLLAYIDQHGHRAVTAITRALRESGILQVRPLDTIPMPPPENEPCQITN